MIPNTPDPDVPEVEEPQPGVPSDTPIDTPPGFPEPDEPGWQAPGADDAPMRLPRDNPDVETEI
jgi:hypothetical protein